MFRDLVDETTWQLMQDQVAATIGLPVITVDKEGEVLFKSGEFPFFCELVDSKGKAHCTSCRKHWAREAEGIYEDVCHAGLYNISVPVIINGKKEGAIIVESIKPSENALALATEAASRIGLDKEELLDELPKMVQEDHQLFTIKSLLETLAGSLPTIAHGRGKDKKDLEELKIQFDFLNELNASFDIQKILNTAINFLIKKFNLEDASARFNGHLVRFAFVEERNQRCKPVEDILWAQIWNRKTPVFIDDVSQDFLFQKVEGASFIQNSLMAVPILWKNEAKGMLILYGPPDKGLKGNDDLLMALSQRLEIVLAGAEMYNNAVQSAITDKLTGLYNKHYFLEALKIEINRAQRFKRPTSLIIFDIDNFKSYNDTYGHVEGDRLLAEIGLLLRENIAGMDVVARYGGEEFCVLLPETKQDHAQGVAERIRKVVDDYDFPNRKTTISIGCCTCMNSSASGDFLLKEADRALYKSKHLGKNRVTSFVIVDRNLATLDTSEVGVKKVVNDS
jgi:diguanylate cyclase (GGDEF)-like protein